MASLGDFSKVTLQTKIVTNELKFHPTHVAVPIKWRAAYELSAFQYAASMASALQGIKFLDMIVVYEDLVTDKEVKDNRSGQCLAIGNTVTIGSTCSSSGRRAC